MASVLVLEDDPDMREMLVMVLDQQGYEVVAVDNGAQAVEQAAQRAFDLIVADIRMKGMDGLEAIHQTKGHQPQIGTMVVSGFASPEETRRASELNVGAYLRKPFRMQQFLKVVAEQLQSAGQSVRQISAEEARAGWLAWALQTLCQSLEESPGTVERAGQLAAAAGQRLNLDPELVSDLRLAAQLLVVQFPQQPSQELLAHAQLVAPWNYAFGSSRESQLAQQAARVARLGWEAARELAPNAEIAGLFDASEPAPVPSAGPGRDSLLALARVLQGSHPEAAAQALTRLRQAPDDPAQAARATLALAEEAGGEEAEALCQEALQLTLRLGPALRTGLQTQIGLLLYKLGAARALPLLESLPGQQELLGLRAARSVTQLLLVRLGQPAYPALQALRENSAEPDYLQRYPWLMSEVLELSWEAAELTALLREYPALVVQASAASDSLSAKMHLLEALEKGSGYIPEEILQQLQEDRQADVRRRATQLLNRSLEPALPPPLRVQSFGTFEVSRGQRQLEAKQWKTRTTQLLFARLASEWGRPFHEDRLVDEFWPDSLDRGKKNLHWSVSAARACVRESAAEMEIVVRQGKELLLSEQIPYWHDLTRFQQLHGEARVFLANQQEEQAVACLRQLCRLYRGPYLEGVYHGWAGPLRDELEHQAGQAHKTLGEILLRSARLEEAVEVGQSAVRMQPHLAEHYEFLMGAYLAVGNPAAAVELYRRCEQTFRRDYQMEPTIEMTRLNLQARSF